MAAGRIVPGAEVSADQRLAPDFCVVGSGAGGSVAAATLAAAGAEVLLLEEGGHYGRRDFNMQEAWAYPALYQEQGNRATEDLSIMVLQGRTVGGSTTVNWTSCFHPPEETLALWRARHGVEDVDLPTLAPHIAAVEARLHVGAGDPNDVNRNNAHLAEGARRLGWRTTLIRRSVKQCARLGYCGLGCPLDAKQSALVSYIPDAIAAGASLITHCRVERLARAGDRITAVDAAVLDPVTLRERARLRVEPRRGVILAGGALNTPALLLRSGIEDAGRVGERTFLHPTVPIMGLFKEPVEAYYGPPQSIACHQFSDRGRRVGYFFETAPVHPMLASIALPGFGADHRELAAQLPYVQATIALLIDGHHDDPGGRVRVDRAGQMKLSYPLSEPLREAAVDALTNMTRLLFAAGAHTVVTLHREPLLLRDPDALPDALAAIRARPFGANLHTLFSAHQMGGCAFGADPQRAVVNSRGRHHRVANLWICDGSVFPTGLGVNPQITIYALARLFASEIVRAG